MSHPICFDSLHHDTEKTRLTDLVKKTQRIKIDCWLKKYNQRVATGTHVKLHVSVLLDRAKIVAPKTTKIFGSGTRTGVTGLRRPLVLVLCIFNTAAAPGISNPGCPSEKN